MEEKKLLRRKYSQIRGNISGKTEKDAAITARILAHEKIVNAKTVLLYSSFRSEVSTQGLSELLVKNGKTIAFPVCFADSIMRFYCVGSTEELTEGAYGIKEPSTESREVEADSDTVCIVPGLAFTENGGRLGYGGGYYDRFISEHPYIYTIALAYEELIANKLPIMQHDLTVDSIVTEERMVLCSAG